MMLRIGGGALRLANDERSHAGPTALDEGESGLPALADAIC